MGGGGFPLVLPSVLLSVFTVIILLRVLVISFRVFFSLLAFFPLSLPFSGFLFCFSFAASSSRSLSLSPSPLSYCSFWPFLRLLCSLFFLRLFFSSLFSSFPSPLSSFSFPFWFLLLSPLAPLSRLSLPFLLLFLLCPLPSSLFIFRLRFFPSTLFFSSCWLFFLLVCPRCLFGGFLFFLFVFLAFGFRFLLVCVFGLFWSSL